MVLKEENLLISFKDLPCRFCMLHGVKEPAMLTGTEGEADSPWNPEVESPADNHDARVLSQTRGGVTNYADHCRS